MKMISRRSILQAAGILAAALILLVVTIMVTGSKTTTAAPQAEAVKIVTAAELVSAPAEELLGSVEAAAEEAADTNAVKTTAEAGVAVSDELAGRTIAEVRAAAAILEIRAASLGGLRQQLRLEGAANLLATKAPKVAVADGVTNAEAAEAAGAFKAAVLDNSKEIGRETISAVVNAADLTVAVIGGGEVETTTADVVIVGGDRAVVGTEGSLNGEISSADNVSGVISVVDKATDDTIAVAVPEGTAAVIGADGEINAIDADVMAAILNDRIDRGVEVAVVESGDVTAATVEGYTYYTK